jgi:hypothetical protein
VKELRYTLLTDGTSDRALLPVLNWLLRGMKVQAAIQPRWADLGRLRNRPKGLPERIVKSIELYPSEALRLADLIDDYAPLRVLPAFQRLEADLNQAMVTHF